MFGVELPKKKNSFITPSIHLFTKYLLNMYFVLDTKDAKDIKPMTSHAFITMRTQYIDLKSKLYTITEADKGKWLPAGRFPL